MEFPALVDGRRQKGRPSCISAVNFRSQALVAELTFKGDTAVRSFVSCGAKTFGEIPMRLWQAILSVVLASNARNDGWFPGGFGAKCPQ